MSRGTPLRDDLLLYYERELTFLRQMGAEFAAKYPKIASRLVLEPDKCEDPHVERMLEAFSFLAARVHLKIDDEFPEITEALLSILYPHYLRPIPSMSVAQFHVDSDQVTPETGLTLPRGSVLNSRPVNGVPCKFRTSYDVTFWPVEVEDAEWKTPDRLQPAIRSSEAVAAIRLALRCPGDLTFAKLSMKSLRFYLNGESNLIHSLYELLSNNCVQIVVRDRLAEIEGAAGHPARRRAAARGLRGRRRHSSVPAPLVCRLSPVAGILLFPAEVLLPRSDRPGRSLRRGLRRPHRGDPADLAVRTQRAPADAGARCQRQHLPAGLRADRKPVSANRRADSARSHALRIPGGPRRQPAQRHRGLRDHRGPQRESAIAGGRPLRALLLVPPRYIARRQGPGVLAHFAPSFGLSRRWRHRSVRRPRGPLVAARPAGCGRAHGAHRLHQSRSAVTAAVRQ